MIQSSLSSFSIPVLCCLFHILRSDRRRLAGGGAVRREPTHRLPRPQRQARDRPSARRAPRAAAPSASGIARDHPGLLLTAARSRAAMPACAGPRKARSKRRRRPPKRCRIGRLLRYCKRGRWSRSGGTPRPGSASAAFAPERGASWRYRRRFTISPLPHRPPDMRSRRSALTVPWFLARDSLDETRRLRVLVEASMITMAIGSGSPRRSDRLSERSAATEQPPRARAARARRARTGSGSPRTRPAGAGALGRDHFARAALVARKRSRQVRAPGKGLPARAPPSGAGGRTGCACCDPSGTAEPGRGSGALEGLPRRFRRPRCVGRARAEKTVASSKRRGRGSSEPLAVRQRPRGGAAARVGAIRRPALVLGQGARSRNRSVERNAGRRRTHGRLRRRGPDRTLAERLHARGGRDARARGGEQAARSPAPVSLRSRTGRNPARRVGAPGARTCPRRGSRFAAGRARLVRPCHCLGARWAILAARARPIRARWLSPGTASFARFCR